MFIKYRCSFSFGFVDQFSTQCSGVGAVPDGIHNDALPGLRSLFNSGPDQDARATMEIKFCSKTPLFPL